MKKTLVLISLILLLAWLASCAAPQKGGRQAEGGASASSVEAAEEPIGDPAGDGSQSEGVSGRERAAGADGGAPVRRVAVYVTGGKSHSENRALGARIEHALMGSGEYSIMERAGAFSDRAKAASRGGGAVDDGQISRLGRQAGADFVCIGEILEAFGAYQISIRVVDVESVEVVASGVASGSLKSMVDFAALAGRAVALLLRASADVGAPGGASSAGSAPVARAQAAGVIKTPDGGSYRYVQIGGAVWMAENLNIVVDSSWCYGGIKSNCAKYGRLYTWDAAMSACPKGWHLPNGSEWDNLVDAAGGDGFAGGKLKSNSGWMQRGNGTDDFGFSALPGGHRDDDGEFNAVGAESIWWSASNARFRNILYTVNNVFDNYYDKGYGLSVRCVLDSDGVVALGAVVDKEPIGAAFAGDQPKDGGVGASVAAPTKEPANTAIAGSQPQSGGGGASAAKQKPLPKIAVYVTGGKTAEEDRAYSARITHALVGSGRYNTIERADAFLTQVAREVGAQMDGAVDDSRISRLGRQAGAGFVCIGEIVEAFGATQVSARILNVESVEVTASGLASGPLKTMADFTALSISVVEQLLGADKDTAKAASAQPAAAKFRTVTIGENTWMAENLNIETKGSWCYGDAALNCAKYGRLYTWEAAKTACPSGWHLPDTAEWADLVDAAGGERVAGKRLKSTSGWEAGGSGTDNLGFSALPGGTRYSFGFFGDIGTFGRWWSATGLGASHAYRWYIMHHSGGDDANRAYSGPDDAGGGLSVRCVRDRGRGKK